MDYYKRANELKEDTIEIRRYLHKNAEVGLDLPNTVEYVMKQLKEYGIQPQLCGHGVTATIGKGKPVILLRADMDALRVEEKVDVGYKWRRVYLYFRKHACLWP